MDGATVGPAARLAALRTGGHELMLFWGHTAVDGTVPGPYWLSQWWPAAFEVDGDVYPTAEHWMMAGKARLFDDDHALRTVLAAAGPKQAKAAGRAVRGFDTDTWQRAAYDLVVEGNLAKFGQHVDLREYLLGTAPAVLVESSPHDRIWGTGLAPDHRDARDPRRWPGTNLLGFALTDVRERLAGR